MKSRVCSVTFMPRLPFGMPVQDTDFFGVPRDCSSEDLGAIYTTNFEVGNAPFPLFERSYSETGDAELFEELYRFYEFFGLSCDNGKIGDWPDSLIVELEFMHYLGFLEAKHDGTTGSLGRAQRDFLERHLLGLTTGLGNALSNEGLVYYTGLAAALQRFVTADLSFLRYDCEGRAHAQR